MIKSGAVIQNRYLNNPYPTNYNPLGRPGNFDVARPHDSSSVFDTGLPKDVSPYQPRVAVSVEIQPKSVFKPRRLQRQLKQKNGAMFGQTVLKSIFGGEENVITNYMAQRLLGIVDGAMSVDTRASERMQLDNPLLDFRDPNVASTVTSPTQPSTPVSDTSMGARSSSTVPANLFDLSLGEAPLRISIPEQPSTDLQGAEMEAVAEVETQPLEAAAQGGLLDIMQETLAGPATVTPRRRGFGLRDALSPTSDDEVL